MDYMIYRLDNLLSWHYVSALSEGAESSLSLGVLRAKKWGEKTSIITFKFNGIAF